MNPKDPTPEPVSETVDVQPIPIELRHDPEGGGAMEITVNGWVYVRVNYHRHYTSNAYRYMLAKQILALVNGDCDTETAALRRELEEVKAQGEFTATAYGIVKQERNDRQQRLETAQTEIVNLRADLAAAKEETKRVNECRRLERENFSQQLTAAQARADAGEKDAKRLDWLQANGGGLSAIVGEVSPGVLGSMWEYEDAGGETRGPTVRAAIDAASEGVGE